MNKMLRKVVERYGADAQLNVAVEELSELIKALCKYKRGEENYKNIAEEMADVSIILSELKIIFDNTEAVSDWKKRKLRRLKMRMLKEVLIGGDTK